MKLSLIEKTMVAISTLSLLAIPFIHSTEKDYPSSILFALTAIGSAAYLAFKHERYRV